MKKAACFFHSNVATKISQKWAKYEQLKFIMKNQIGLARTKTEIKMLFQKYTYALCSCSPLAQQDI